MTPSIVVREYARLTTSIVNPTFDQATISKSAFDWLCKLASKFRTSGAQLLQIDNTQWLRLDNFVGILETPCGTTIEILPKHHDSESAIEKSRALLCRMIQAALDLPSRDVSATDITLFDAPLSEWIISQFLRQLDHLLKRGLKFDYCRVEEEQRNFRGQLNIALQVRQPPHRAHYFHIRHDVFSADCTENRLIKAALLVVCKRTQHPRNWRLSHELREIMSDIPDSKSVDQDFASWRSGRLMTQYQAIRPWCELILRQYMPMAIQGEWYGMSMLFPMEKLFERFVEAALRRDLNKDSQVTNQSRQQHICQHLGKGFFQLQPDLMVQNQNQHWILDAKWKRLNQSSSNKKYGISQADFYQLFAYGHKYIKRTQNEKELVLIYPRTATFSKPLPSFDFDSTMKLWVLPFELGEKFGEECLHIPSEMHLNSLMNNPSVLTQNTK